MAAGVFASPTYLTHVGPQQGVLLPAGRDEGPDVVRHGLGPGGPVPFSNLGCIPAGCSKAAAAEDPGQS